MTGNQNAHPDLQDWLNSLPAATQRLIAEKAGTSIGQLRHIAYGNRSCSARLAVEIDKFSEGKVPMTKLCPEIDWEHVKLFVHAR